MYTSFSSLELSNGEIQLEYVSARPDQKQPPKHSRGPLSRYWMKVTSLQIELVFRYYEGLLDADQAGGWCQNV